MRGAWLVCALSLARAAETPLPGDPALNEQWLEGFRRDLLRETYDYDTDPKPSSSRPGLARDTMGRVSDKPSLDALVGPARHPLVDKSMEQVSDERDLPSDAPDAPSVGYSSGKPLARRSKDEKSVELSSGEPGLPPDTPDAPSVGHSYGKPDGYTSDRPGPAPDAPDAPSPARSPGRLQARHVLDASKGKPVRLSEALDAPPVRLSSGRPPAHSLDDTASRELGISRRDLYGGRGRSVTGLDAKRQPFMKSLADLDNQMRPVVIRPDLHIADKSRKRLWDGSGEQNQEKPEYIVDDKNGVKLYRVHTNRKERFQNQFGRGEPWFKEEWGIDEMLAPNADQEREDENPAQNEDRYQESREESTQDKQDSVSRELDVSEYNQDNLRSRYIQDGRSNRDYAQRFSARRDAALLADGLASSDKPCNCMTDDPQIVPEL